MKAWNNLGLLYENQGTSKVLLLAIWQHCSKYFIIGMYKEAERILREGIKQLPNDPLLHYSLGVLLGRINRLQVLI